MNQNSEKSIATIIWAVLFFAVAYTSNAIVGVFGQFVQAVGSIAGGQLSGLFSSGNAAVILLSLLVLALVVFAFFTWRGLVSLTLELVIAFSSEEESVFAALLDSDDEDASSSIPSTIVSNLAYLWVLYFVVFLIFPFAG
jgi:hypothetical protein